jgi:hypothetical protein
MPVVGDLERRVVGAMERRWRRSVVDRDADAATRRTQTGSRFGWNLVVRRGNDSDVI